MIIQRLNNILFFFNRLLVQDPYVANHSDITFQFYEQSDYNDICIRHPLNAAIFVSYPVPKFKTIQREQTTTSDVWLSIVCVAHCIGKYKLFYDVKFDGLRAYIESLRTRVKFGISERKVEIMVMIGS